MAQCMDVEESPEEERNGAFSIPRIKRCLEAGRILNEGIFNQVQRSKSPSFERQEYNYSV